MGEVEEIIVDLVRSNTEMENTVDSQRMHLEDNCAVRKTESRKSISVRTFDIRSYLPTINRSEELLSLFPFPGRNVGSHLSRSAIPSLFLAFMCWVGEVSS